VSILTERDPQPKTSSDAPDRIGWAVRSWRRCPPVIPPSEGLIIGLLESRRSGRTIGPAPLREVINAIAFATRPRFVLEDDPYQRTRRVSPSAGALHAVDILIIDQYRSFPRIWRYDPLAHSLETLRIAQPSSVQRFSTVNQELLPAARATTLVFVGDMRRIGALYEHPHSLLWRDAGALLQTLALVATAYRLAFCPLGILGGEVLDALMLDRTTALPLGCAAIGRPFDENSRRSGRG
jgi:SagB-type dehydrogenase family enzyme